MSKLLLVEDDREIQEFNRELLKEQGYTVTLAMNLKEARKKFTANPPDLIVLDVMLPDGCGFDWLAELRTISNVLVLMLTAKGGKMDKRHGYRCGADDYLSKPYDYEELVAKIKVLLKRAEQMPEHISFGEMMFDTLSGQAFYRGKELSLKSKEYHLLLLLMQNERKIISAEDLYKKVWNAPLSGNKNALQVTVSNLRNKIQPLGYDICNIQGKGYYLE